MNRGGWRESLRISERAFGHPAVLLSVLVLLLNDHVLKARFPSFWTGKLSDFAGLFFAPFLAIPILAILTHPLRLPAARAADLGFGLAGLLFAGVKLAPAVNAAVSEAVSAFLGRPAAFALDPTDGIALLVLIPARWLWGRIAREVRGDRRAAPRWAWAVWILAMAASLATSPCPSPGMVRRVILREGRMYAGLRFVGESGGTWAFSEDGGRTWERFRDPPDALKQEPMDLGWPVQRCRPDAPSECARIPGPGRVERSRDGGASCSCRTVGRSGSA